MKRLEPRMFFFFIVFFFYYVNDNLEIDYCYNTATNGGKEGDNWGQHQQQPPSKFF